MTEAVFQRCIHPSCGATCGVGETAFACPRCGGLLDVAYDWQLAPLKLPVGTVITFHAEAIDYDSIKGPNVGKSREVRESASLHRSAPASP